MLTKMWVIESDRLILRRLTPDDAENVLQIVGDSETMRFYPHTLDLAGAKQLILRHLQFYKRHGIGLWAVTIKPGMDFVGTCGLIPQDVEGEQETEIGYMFVRNYWGKGYATESAIRCREYAKQELGLHRVVSLIDRDNLPSQRVAQKIGMKKEKEIFKWDRNIWVFAMQL
jgi:RimJ/RimL family protein N-acetyltransferase